MSNPPTVSNVAGQESLAGGGEMGERIRAFDWASTSLGPIEGWSPALTTLLRIMLANRFPHVLWWGPQYIQFYNDPYRPVLGAKHPHPGLGCPGCECWSEIWHVIGPLVDRPFFGGPATWDDDIFLEVNRHGFVEESHFTIAYSPVPDETVLSGIGGVLATVHEITGKVVGDRRVVVLRDLGTRSAEARTAEDACAIAAGMLVKHSKDIPFALLYLIDPDRKQARLAAAAGVEAGQPASPVVLAMQGDEANCALWPLAETMRSEAVQTVTDLAGRLRGQVPPGPWTDPPHTAVVVPIRSNKAHWLAGFLVAGVSARLQLDDPYRDFLNLVSSQIATAIANAREYEEEKKRAEALAEIDRAKTLFFSNVSHEFRTPLTLMLGPLEELLSRSHTELPPAARGQLEVTHRNSLRLLRLVNTLLDFSRIEAGRVQAVFEPTDLAAFTAELASVFRAATERAGLRLTVDCPMLSQPVYVDRDTWEKIVLNLVSNAFKFTFEGEIAVTLRSVGEVAELRVRDTGVGIPAEEMPRVFERFHRVPNVRSRTYEGSGIGLALVQELVKLHGGSVRAESRLDEGTTFIVSVPLGKDHLPPERIGGSLTLPSTSVGVAPFVEEALRWLPEDASAEEIEPLPREELLLVPCHGGEGDESRPRLLIADDNADMRQYLARLLTERYNVQTVSNGQAALAAARDRRPDLVLSDVMMPHLDGLGLVREMRGDADLRTVPIILLSARAGEESRIEGLLQGADDYLIKPFNARELMARVLAHLDMARLRKQSEDELKLARESAERSKAAAEQASRAKDHFLAVLSHELRTPLTPVVMGVSMLLERPDLDPAIREILEMVRRNVEMEARLIDDLLDVTRIARGKVELTRTAVELSTIINGAVEVCKPDIEERKLHFGVDLGTAGPYWIEADVSRLQQVFWNLLKNAIKFTRKEGCVDIRCQRSGEYVNVEVSDSGLGIEPEALGRIFNAFEQAERSITQKFGGLGLGLAISKALIEMHGGQIEAFSEGPGKGATFRVRLPLVASPGQADECMPASPQQLAVRPLHILLVEDHPVTAKLMGMSLTADGHIVEMAGDVATALELAGQNTFDLLLSDLGLRDGSGYDLIRQLRQRGYKFPCIALSGYGQEEDIQRSHEAGFAAHLTKPASRKTVIDAIASVTAED